jgi:Nuclease-related domain
MRRKSRQAINMRWPAAIQLPGRDRTVVGETDKDAAKRTDLVLRRLPEREWTVLEDIDPKHGVDHVLVGPGGIFAITSRKPDGPGVRVKDGVLLLRKGHDMRTVRPGVGINRSALDATRLLDREIRAHTGHHPPIHPVVVLWCEFPQAVAESSQIAFVHGRDLLQWLSRRPRRLDDQGRNEIVAVLRAARSSGHSRHLHLGRRGRAA